MKQFKEFSEKYDAYYAMVDAKAMAKKYGGDPDDYIDKLMKKAGNKKDTYSGHGVWQWVKEGFELSEGEIGDVEKLMKKGLNAKQIGKKKGYSPRRIKALAKMMELMKMLQKNESVEEGTMRAGIFDSDIKKRKDAARKLVFFLKSKRNLKIGPMNDKQGGSNKAIDSYIKELMKYVFDDLMIDGLYPTGKNADVKANDVVVKRLKKMGVRVK